MDEMIQPEKTLAVCDPAHISSLELDVALVPEPPTNYDSSVTEGGVCQILELVVRPAEALALR